jgi:DnaJ-class molecular chaperone
MNHNLYELLNSNKSDDLNTIKKNYKKLVKIHHPDKGGDNEYFKKITKAFEILSNDESRNLYDRTGKTPDDHTYHDDIFNHSDVFVSNINDIFGDFFNNKNRNKKNKCGNIIKNINISLSDSYIGKSFNIIFNKTIICDNCNGKGGEKIIKCITCKGNGIMRDDI